MAWKINGVIEEVADHGNAGTANIQETLIHSRETLWKQIYRQKNEDIPEVMRAKDFTLTELMA